MDSVRELGFLQDLVRAAASTLDAEDLLRLVISETTGAVETDVCSIYLVDGEDLVLTATNGLSQAGVGRVRLGIGEGVTGWAAEVREPVVVADVREEERFRWLHGVDQARFVSMCSVPIISGDRLVGALNVQTDERREFNDSDVRLLTSIAAQVAGVIERSELQRRLNERIDDLHRSEIIQADFDELTLARAGLTAICARIADDAQTPVGIYDPEGHWIDGTPGDALPTQINVDGPLPDGKRESVAINAAGEMLGILVVGASTSTAGPGRALALKHGVTVIAFELLRRRSAAETEERLRGDLVDEILSTRLTKKDADALARRATRLGVPIRGSSWVLLVEPGTGDGRSTFESEQTRRRVARGILDLVTDRGGLAVSRFGGVVALVPGDTELGEIERLARAIREMASALAGGAEMIVGVSSRAGEVAELHRLAEEAGHAVRVSRSTGATNAVAPFRQLGVERLLFELGDHERLADFVDELLAPLSAHEERGNGAAPLIESLDALVAEGWNLRATARRLTVHINTLLYRTGKIEELTGRKLDDPGDRLALSLALRARTMLSLSDVPSEGSSEEIQTSRTYHQGRKRRTVEA